MSIKYIAFNILFLIGLLCLFKIRKKYKKKEGMSNSIKNIYGGPLQTCRKNESDANGSWDTKGYCSELDGGVHQICFNVNNDTKHFSNQTYQSNWSQNRINKNHCMCLGAWALYKARQAHNQIPSTQNELLCNAIPETALEPNYIEKWSTWNTHELDDQITHGVNALYSQCYNKATPSQKKYLENKYTQLMKKVL